MKEPFRQEVDLNSGKLGFEREPFIFEHSVKLSSTAPEDSSPYMHLMANTSLAFVSACVFIIVTKN